MASTSLPSWNLFVKDAVNDLPPSMQCIGNARLSGNAKFDRLFEIRHKEPCKIPRDLLKVAKPTDDQVRCLLVGCSPSLPEIDNLSEVEVGKYYIDWFRRSMRECNKVVARSILASNLKQVKVQSGDQWPFPDNWTFDSKKSLSRFYRQVLDTEEKQEVCWLGLYGCCLEPHRSTVGSDFEVLLMARWDLSYVDGDNLIKNCLRALFSKAFCDYKRDLRSAVTKTMKWQFICPCHEHPTFDAEWHLQFPKGHVYSEQGGPIAPQTSARQAVNNSADGNVVCSTPAQPNLAERSLRQSPTWSLDDSPLGDVHDDFPSEDTFATIGFPTAVNQSVAANVGPNTSSTEFPFPGMGFPPAMQQPTAANGGSNPAMMQDTMQKMFALLQSQSAAGGSNVAMMQVMQPVFALLQSQCAAGGFPAQVYNAHSAAPISQSASLFRTESNRVGRRQQLPLSNIGNTPRGGITVDTQKNLAAATTAFGSHQAEEEQSDDDCGDNDAAFNIWQDEESTHAPSASQGEPQVAPEILPMSVKTKSTVKGGTKRKSKSTKKNIPKKIKTNTKSVAEKGAKKAGSSVEKETGKRKAASEGTTSKKATMAVAVLGEGATTIADDPTVCKIDHGKLLDLLTVREPYVSQKNGYLYGMTCHECEEKMESQGTIGDLNPATACQNVPSGICNYCLCPKCRKKEVEQSSGRGMRGRDTRTVAPKAKRSVVPEAPEECVVETGVKGADIPESVPEGEVAEVSAAVEETAEEDASFVETGCPKSHEPFNLTAAGSNYLIQEGNRYAHLWGKECALCHLQMQTKGPLGFACEAAHCPLLPTGDCSYCLCPGCYQDSLSKGSNEGGANGRRRIRSRR